jgi:hypothetical protein
MTQHKLSTTQKSNFAAIRMVVIVEAVTSVCILQRREHNSCPRSSPASPVGTASNSQRDRLVTRRTTARNDHRDGANDDDSGGYNTNSC